MLMVIGAVVSFFVTEMGEAFIGTCSSVLQTVSQLAVRFLHF
jgi:hypothetical protein